MMGPPLSRHSRPKRVSHSDQQSAASRGRLYGRSNLARKRIGLWEGGAAAAALAEPEMLADELFLLLEGVRVTAQSVGPKGTR